MAGGRGEKMVEHKDIEKWREIAERELRGKPLETLNWTSAEGLLLKPLYTAADIENIDFADSLPGIDPFVRGPRATMYA